jgi:metallo-beta-lactamase class B
MISLPRLLISFSALAATAALGQSAEFRAQRAEWNRPMEPFRIAGNVHYVGTEGLSAFLITDPKGHILIDGAMEESAAQIAANIRRLGFRMEDVRYLLVNHAHWDHAGGLAELKRLSGAKLLASAGDKPELESGRIPYRSDIPATTPVKVDGIIRDGQRIKLGGTTLVTLLTPGHTRGCTSWTMRTREGRRPLDILFACSLTVAGQPLVNDARYPQAAADFRRTFARLKRLRADVFLNFHPSFFDLEIKRRRQRAGNATAFVDPGELARRVQRAEADFAAELARQRAIAQ